MMSDDPFSLQLWCWRDVRSDAIRLRVVLIDSGEEVRLAEGSFLLRIDKVKGSAAERCLIRHISSGREVYIQSGSKLRTFIKDCLLEDGKPGSTDTTTPGE